MKDVVWNGDSLKAIRDFPIEARTEAGRQLLRVQHGDDPLDWKPITTVGRGVREIRVKLRGQFRVFYVANIGDKVHVLHAFQKKSQKTQQRDIDLGKQRLKEAKNG